MFILLPVILMFVGLGILFSRGKGTSLIAGYNTASKEKKARYNEKALCRFLGGLMFFSAFAMGLLVFGSYFPGYYIVEVAISMILGGPLFAVIYTNTSKRFRNQNKM